MSVLDKTSKHLIVMMLLEQQKMKAEIERLKQQIKPVDAIGFHHVKVSEQTPETAFRSYSKYSGGYD